jgi:hypothetical protein
MRKSCSDEKVSGKGVILEMRLKVAMTRTSLKV